MNMKIPFTKDILFKSKIAEITSISLEHELNVEDEVSGHFIISGDYKTHEVCVNKEEFEYKLPFNVELTDNIDKSTLNLEIIDFYYDIIGDDTLRVNIEFMVSAEKMKEEQEEEEEIIPEEKIKEDREIVDFEPVEETINDIPLDIPEVMEQPQEQEEEEEERLNEEEKNTILNTISTSDNEFITYNVHIVRGMKTLESICETYKVSMDLVKEYNNIETINIGDKIIIPIEKDE